MDISYHENTNIYTATISHICKSGVEVRFICMDSNREAAVKAVKKEYEESGVICAIWSQPKVS